MTGSNTPMTVEVVGSNTLVVAGGGEEAVGAHNADTTNVHGIVDTVKLVTTDTAQAITGTKTFGDQANLNARANMGVVGGRFSLLHTSPLTATSLNPALFGQVLNRTSGTNVIVAGVHGFGRQDDAAGNIGAVYGLMGEAEQTAGNVNFLQGIVGSTVHSGGTVASRITGVTGSPVMSGATATGVNMFGIRAVPIVTAGTITGSVHGIAIPMTILGGTMVDTYGLHITTESGGTVSGRRYGIFVSLGHVDAVGQVIRARASQVANLQEWQSSAAAVLFSIDANGFLKWTSAKEQATVGAAGAASALPAAPTKYLQVKDSAGATFVVPAYAAA